MRAVDRRVWVPRIGQIVGLTGVPPRRIIRSDKEYPRDARFFIRKIPSYPRAAASLFVGRRNFFIPARTVWSPFCFRNAFFWYSAGDSARIRSGFAFREKKHRSRQIFEIFLQNPQISCPVGAKVSIRMPRGVPFGSFFVLFLVHSPARMSDRPRARATRRGTRRAPRATPRRAEPSRVGARRVGVDGLRGGDTAMARARRDGCVSLARTRGVLSPARARRPSRAPNHDGRVSI